MRMSLVTMVMTIGAAMIASIAQMMVLNMQKKMGASFAQEMMQLLVITQMAVLLYNSLLLYKWITFKGRSCMIMKNSHLVI